jgi:hypothetical protein
MVSLILITNLRRTASRVGPPNAHVEAEVVGEVDVALVVDPLLRPLAAGAAVEVYGGEARSVGL